LGVRASALDGLVVEKRGVESAASGKRLDLKDPAPWAESVAGAALLDALIAMFARCVIAPHEALITVALWTLFTYVIDVFDINPILAIQSAQKRCGKTTGMKMLRGVVRRPLPGANVTGATIFRVIERSQPTLLLDEGDSFLDDNEEIRGILNSAHDREMAWVPRLVPLPGGDYEPRTFSTFAAIAIALIQKLPDTLEDRAIAIPLKRKLKSEKAEKYRARKYAPELDVLAQKCARWAVDNCNQLAAMPDPEDLDELDDRASDNWYPLRIIAQRIGGEWPAKAAAAAVLLSKDRNEGDTDSLGEMLLADLRAIFKETGQEQLSSKRLCEELHKREDRPWPEYAKMRKPISQPQLARLLKPFKICPTNVRVPEVAKGYKLAELQDAFERYRPTDNAAPVGEEAERSEDRSEAVNGAQQSAYDGDRF
jgi:putative DNA primase/helicase